MRGSPMVNGEQLVYTFAISKIPSDSEIIFFLKSSFFNLKIAFLNLSSTFK